MFCRNFLPLWIILIWLWNHFNSYWHFFTCAIWIFHNNCRRFITWCWGIWFILPLVFRIFWKVIFVRNTISWIWRFSMLRRNFLTLWIILIWLWSNFNSYWHFFTCTIWIFHNNCRWFITWCWGIWLVFPHIICISWQITFISNTICWIWSFIVFCRNILALWIVLIWLWNYLNSYWDFFNYSTWKWNYNCRWFITWCWGIWLVFPLIFSISGHFILVCNTFWWIWCFIVFCRNFLTFRNVVVLNVKRVWTTMYFIAIFDSTTISIRI